MAEKTKKRCGSLPPAARERERKKEGKKEKGAQECLFLVPPRMKFDANTAEIRRGMPKGTC